MKTDTGHTQSQADQAVKCQNCGEVFSPIPATGNCCPCCGKVVTDNLLVTLQQFADAVHELAWSKGWHDLNETEDHFIERACNNMHGEVCELYEAWRDNKLHSNCDKANKMTDLGLPVLTCIEEEMADIIIRALDQAKRLNVDIMRAVRVKHEFNKSREQRHGGKRS